MAAPEILMFSNTRLSFPHFVEPHAAGNDPNAKKKYAADFIIAPNDPTLAQFMQRYTEMAQAKWGEHYQQVMAMIQSDRKLRCYGNGSEKIDKKTFKPYLGYEGMVYLSASKDTPPQMVGLDGKPIDPANSMAYQAMARKLYGGCYVNVALKPWIQENKHGRGIRCDLVAIQFAKDGEAFGDSAEPDVSSMFGAVAAPAVAAAVPGFAPSPFAAAPAPAPTGLPAFFG